MMQWEVYVQIELGSPYPKYKYREARSPSDDCKYYWSPYTKQMRHIQELNNTRQCSWELYERLDDLKSKVDLRSLLAQCVINYCSSKLETEHQSRSLWDEIKVPWWHSVHEIIPAKHMRYIGALRTSNFRRITNDLLKHSNLALPLSIDIIEKRQQSSAHLYLIESAQRSSICQSNRTVQDIVYIQSWRELHLGSEPNLTVVKYT